MYLIGPFVSPAWRKRRPQVRVLETVSDSPKAVHAFRSQWMPCAHAKQGQPLPAAAAIKLQVVACHRVMQVAGENRAAAAAAAATSRAHHLDRWRDRWLLWLGQDRAPNGRLEYRQHKRVAGRDAFLEAGKDRRGVGSVSGHGKRGGISCQMWAMMRSIEVDFMEGSGPVQVHTHIRRRFVLWRRRARNPGLRFRCLDRSSDPAIHT